MKSNSPIVPALTLLSKEDRIQSTLLKSAIAGIAEDITNTSSVADLLAEYDNIFSPFYVAVIRTGEQSGTIVDALANIISVHDFERQLEV